MTFERTRPDKWAVTQVKDVVDAIDYGHTASAKDSTEGPRFLRITDIQQGRVNWDEVPSCDLTAEELARYRLANGDLVFARTGATTGKSFLIRNCPDDAVFASYLIRLRASAVLDPAFLSYYFQTADYWRQISETSTGTAQPGVNATKLNELQLPVAPAGEQQRIVQAIESYFTRLDDAVATLERVEHNLKRYRASVLKSAVEGRLVPTEAALAKQEGRDYEPASVLLERILTERRRRWAESGKRGKYQEATPPDTTNPPGLPEGWCWATVDQLGESVTGTTPATAKPEYYGGDLPFFKPTDLDFGYSVTVARDFLSEEGRRQARVLPVGSVLVTCIGATIGKTGLARVECATNQQINALVPDPPLRDVFFLFWFFASPFGQSGVIENASSTTMPILNKGRFERLVVPVPPLCEQVRIVAEVERLVSLTNGAEMEVERVGRKCSRLRQSILKWAFEGKLADQDPNDEPASVLLERIKAERETTKPAKGKKKLRA